MNNKPVTLTQLEAAYNRCYAIWLSTTANKQPRKNSVEFYHALTRLGTAIDNQKARDKHNAPLHRAITQIEKEINKIQSFKATTAPDNTPVIHYYDGREHSLWTALAIVKEQLQ